MNEVKQLGNYETERAWDNPQTGRVYAIEGLSPTLNTCGGGGHEVKIITQEVKKLFDIPIDVLNDNERQRRVYDTDGISPSILSRQDSPKILQAGNINPNETGQSGNVYLLNGISPTLDTCQGGNRMPKIVEPIIVASRGRNPSNQSDRTTGAPTEQRLEPNSEGICNTLTSVQKDNYVLEPLRVGQISSDGSQCGTVYSEDGLSPTLSAGTHGYANAHVMVKQATKDGYTPCKVMGVADLSFPSSTTRRGRVQDNGDTCPTLMASENEIYKIESPYRIRKLTPRECWRLMDFTDLDFFSAMLLDHEAAVRLMEKYKDNLNGIEIMREAETMQKMSNTQLYKQAGNSIVKAVLIGIFKQLF